MLVFNDCVLEPDMKVRIKDCFDYECENSIIVDSMEEWCGQIVTISNIYENEGAFKIKEDDGWYWDLSCIAEVIGNETPSFKCDFTNL